MLRPRGAREAGLMARGPQTPLCHPICLPPSGLLSFSDSVEPSRTSPLPFLSSQLSPPPPAPPRRTSPPPHPARTTSTLPLSTPTGTPAWHRLPGKSSPRGSAPRTVLGRLSHVWSPRQDSANTCVVVNQSVSPQKNLTPGASDCDLI